MDNGRRTRVRGDELDLFEPTFPISTSDPCSSDLPVTNNQNLIRPPTDIVTFKLHGFILPCFPRQDRGMVMSCRAGRARPVSLWKPGFVELPVSISSLEFLVVSGVVERQFVRVVPHLRVCTRSQ